MDHIRNLVCNLRSLYCQHSIDEISVTENSKVKSLDDKVMEREIEQKMRDLFPSYSGIHQPKNERQPNFHGNYSTFFVRFDDETDAKVSNCY